MSKFFRHAPVVLMLALASASMAQIAQEPLLNRPNSVPPNLTLIMDTSGSMDEDEIYEYGNDSNLGPRGSNDSRKSQSPDVNRLYYDPRVRYLPRADYAGNDLANNSTITTWNVYFRNGSGSYTAGENLTYYTPSYTPPSSILAVGASVEPYPNVFPDNGGSVNTKFPKFFGRTDCAATWCSRTEERVNYNNWYKWYRTRLLMAQTGIGLAFLPIKAESIRLGYGSIKTLNDSSSLNRGVSLYTDVANGQKNKFFDWLYAQNAADGTPNLVAIRNVGRYHERKDSDGPWATTPNPSSVSTSTSTTSSSTEPITSHASCRRSFSMLVTDGYWNGTVPTTAGNSDNTGFSIAPAIGPAFVYSPVAPYKDSVSNTMADLAMHYWGRDLRPDLANRVPVINTASAQNPSTWQNVSFYAVTLGLQGTLPRTAATIANLTSGATSWPTPTADNKTTIDDTWHATINGRGELLNANNASELTNAMKRMLETIGGTPQTLSGVAVSTTFLKSGTRKFKPEYVPGTWSGRLSAIALDEATGNDKVPPLVHWQVEKGLDSNNEPISLIPAPASRKIFTWSGSAGVPFNDTNSGLSADLVNYLKGDSSKELRKAGGVYRNREAKLGDIVNSSPAFIQGNIDLKYEALTPVGSFGNYRAYFDAKKVRAGVLYVGANDGMLHGFSDLNGSEIFAYVPKAVISNLFKLSETPYTHQYYVDGPNVETDAFLGGNWKNILLGTTGAGAKAVYAIDVTNPSAMDASKVMWEVNSATPNFSQLGYVLSDVQAGILPNGNWVAIFGNGFGSTGGVASLFVVDLATGTLLKEISTSIGGGNGLGGVRVVMDNNRRIVGAYAGDLKGNMWKFDLTGASTNWKVGLSGAALYAAGNTQPITATPAVLPHPTTGYVVAFGTGKFYETADAQTSTFTTQRLYGVWDAQPFGAVSTPIGAAVTGVGSLVQQTITTVTVGTATTVDFYRVSTNTVTWGDGLSGVRGWYINLPNSGQRVAYPMERLFGTFILASTLSPVSSAAADICVQTGSGSGWVYIIDGVTGSGTTKPTLDTNQDGVIDPSDVPVSGFQDPVDGRPTPITIEEGKTACIETAQTTCTQIKLECGQIGTDACPPNPIPGLRSREWRQLFMR